MFSSPAGSSPSSPRCPDAPRKKRPRLALDFSRLDRIPSLNLPPTPPPAPRKRPQLASKRPKVAPIPIDWGVSDLDVEARLLARTGRVRAKYWRLMPCDLFEEEDREYLLHLYELYTPAAQPWTIEEVAYLDVMKGAISSRLAALSPASHV